MGTIKGLFNLGNEYNNGLQSPETAYNDIPEFGGYLPDCPVCGNEMRYSHNKCEFKCFECGNIMDQDDWDYESAEWCDFEDTIPYACSACGGPYPHCKTSCKVFDK